MVNQLICGRLPGITHNNGVAKGRLATKLWPSHYRKMERTSWRRDVVFRGDLLNIKGHHIVVLDTADRGVLTQASPGSGSLWIFHASGDTVRTMAIVGIWQETQCIRRVVYSPLRQWIAAWNYWTGNSAAVEFGRIYLWD